MSFLFALVVLAIAAAAIAYALLSRRKAAPAAGPRTLDTLRVGDIVRYRMLPDSNFTVTGFIDYR